MPNTKRNAATHEIGHFAKAIHENHLAVTGCKIEMDEHGWGGTAFIDSEEIPNDGCANASIAFAGCLSEARGELASNVNLVFSDELLQKFKDCIQNFYNTPEDAWYINVQDDGGCSADGSISRGDIERIPAAERNDVTVEAALRGAIDFVNKYWSQIASISLYLESKETIEMNDFFRWLFTN